MFRNFMDRWFGGHLIAEQIAGTSRLVTWLFAVVAAVLLTIGGAISFAGIRGGTSSAA